MEQVQELGLEDRPRLHKESTRGSHLSRDPLRSCVFSAAVQTAPGKPSRDQTESLAQVTGVE